MSTQTMTPRRTRLASLWVLCATALTAPAFAQQVPASSASTAMPEMDMGSMPGMDISHGKHGARRKAGGSGACDLGATGCRFVLDGQHARHGHGRDARDEDVARSSTVRQPHLPARRLRHPRCHPVRPTPRLIWPSSNPCR